MIKKKQDLQAEDFQARFRRLLPRSTDLTLIILKGHLLAEEIINELLFCLLKTPTALEKTKLNFNTKLCFIRSLIPKNSLCHAFDAVEKLNTLRNKLAHHLEPVDLDNLINSFLRTLEDPDPSLIEDYKKEPTHRRLKRCISGLCGMLSGFREAYVILNKKEIPKI